jgi:subtilisin family serine protease
VPAPPPWHAIAVRRVSRAVLALAAAGGLAAGGPATGGAAARVGRLAANQCPQPNGQAEVGVPWAQQRLDFMQAWAITRGQGVTVAVIDSGLSTPGPQLAGLATRVVGPRNLVPGEQPTNISDDCGHGTAAAAIIAAPQVAGTNFVGVAPEAAIMPLKYTDTHNTTAGSSLIAAAIEAAIRGPVRAGVINVSSVVPQDDPALRQAVTDALAADAVVVAAAGNDRQNGNPVEYPAAYAATYPNVIAVGASDTNDQVAQFSETGPYVSLVAPGVGIEIPALRAGFTSDSGTSYAAPFVAGTAALVRAADPRLSAAQVRDRIEATADPLAGPGRNAAGAGVVNPLLAVASLPSAPGGATSSAARPLPPPVRASHTNHAERDRALMIGLGGVVAAVAVGIAAMLRRRIRVAVAE